MPQSHARTLTALQTLVNTPSLPALATISVRVALCVTIMSKRRKSRRALSGLTDDQLRDIGITRSKAWREAQKPFWKE
jgi:uncharacterized protein YjiS (DUF1127 family)